MSHRSMSQHAARAVAMTDHRGDLSAGPRLNRRRDTTGRPGMMAVVLAIAVVALLTLGLHILFR